MKTKFSCCRMCKEVFEYHEYANGETDFPRGELMVHGNKYDALTTGFKARADAQAWLDKELTAAPPPAPAVEGETK